MGESSMPCIVVISDDLTGANGIGGLLSRICKTAVVNYGKHGYVSGGYECLVVNTNSRPVNGGEARARVEAVMRAFEGGVFGKRIDSALRGNVEDELMPFVERGLGVVLTDTIPEYGRYTRGGFTVVGGVKDSILGRFSRIKAIPLGSINEADRLGRLNGLILVVDSSTHEDLRRIAEFTVDKGLVPADPLYLIAYSIQARLGRPMSSRGISLRVGSIVYVVGSTHEVTLRQIKYAEANGIQVVELARLAGEGYRLPQRPSRLIIRLNYIRDRALINRDLVELLADFDALVLSGGETANAVFEESGGLYIEGLTDIMPLVGVGVIRGGLLDGKVIVTKGGFIGGEDAYVRILNFLTGHV